MADLTNAVDKRDYLRSVGFSPGKRGRFSQEMLDALHAAQEKGIVFLERNVNVTTVITIDENGERQEEKRAIDPWAPHPDPIRTNDRYTFVSESGATLSLAVAEACSTCLYSLGWCYCKVPTFERNGEVYTLADNQR